MARVRDVRTTKGGHTCVNVCERPLRLGHFPLRCDHEDFGVSLARIPPLREGAPPESLPETAESHRSTTSFGPRKMTA
eukprot:1555289-Prymnesium_polylepis.1